jgi:hypothetical protein
MFSILKDVALVAIGFGLGRTKHFSNLVAAVKAAVAKVFHKKA